MIELRQDQLRFSFPEVHPEASLSIDFQRTLRIPDDDREYFLPPGLGRFPLQHVDDFAQRIPPSWLEHGGVMLPMYQAEALWLSFHGSYIHDRQVPYPFAIRVATGKIDAVTGKVWEPGLARRPQNYMVTPGQPWLDGYVVRKGLIRQFVAMPLGAGYSAEEQITGRADHGGVQVQVFPMRRDVFERRFPRRPAGDAMRRREYAGMLAEMAAPLAAAPASLGAPMGLAPGGRMRQEIFEDTFELSDWATSQTSRCFVHLAKSMVWRAITGKEPPTVPPTAAEYTRAGLPWFDYYDEGRSAVEGSGVLATLESVLQMGKEKGQVPLPENESVTPAKVVTYRTGNRVREGAF
jgi:hypothetical protein